RFNDLKPEDMDPHKFVYHLGKLKSLNLVDYDETTQRYTLSSQGKLLFNYFKEIPSLQELPIDTFVTLYVTHENKVLAVERIHAPYLGFVGTPSFSIDSSHTIKENAENASTSIGLKVNLELPLIVDTVYIRSPKEQNHHICMFVFYGEAREAHT